MAILKSALQASKTKRKNREWLLTTTFMTISVPFIRIIALDDAFRTFFYYYFIFIYMQYVHPQFCC